MLSRCRQWEHTISLNSTPKGVTKIMKGTLQQNRDQKRLIICVSVRQKILFFSILSCAQYLSSSRIDVTDYYANESQFNHLQHWINGGVVYKIDCKVSHWTVQTSLSQYFHCLLNIWTRFTIFIVLYLYLLVLYFVFRYRFLFNVTPVKK